MKYLRLLILPARGPAARGSGTPGRVAAMLACLWLSLGATQAAEPAGLLRDFGRGHLIIDTVTAQRCVFVDVYIAATRQQWQQGLMRVRSMPLHEGMMFLYPRAREITMWMKNTYLPLDMVFIGPDNRVAHIHRDAVPHSEAVISSVASVNQVLELNAGAADTFGIEPGDRIVLSAD